MRRLCFATRLWAALLLIVGVVDLIGALSQSGRYGGVLPLWPVVELLTGAAGFYFSAPAFLPAFSLLLIWDDVLDLLAGTWNFWLLPSLLLAALIWLHYGRLRRQMHDAAGDEPAPPCLQRSRRALPLVSLALGLLALPMMWLLLLYLNTAFLPGEPRPAGAIWMVPGLIALAAAGLGLGVGSLQAGYPARASSAIGVATSSLALLSVLAIFVLNSI